MKFEETKYNINRNLRSLNSRAYFSNVSFDYYFINNPILKLYKLILLLIFSLLSLAINSQNGLQYKVDSLERVLNTLDKSDDKQIVGVGEFIIENSSSDLQKYQVLGIIINTYAVKNQKQKSIHSLFKAKEIAERMDDPEKIVRVYGTIASLYASLDLTEKASQYIQLSREQIKRLPNGKTKYNLNAFIYSETGTMYYNNREYKEANNNYKKSFEAYGELVKLDSSVQNSFYYRNAVYNLGKSFLYIQQPDSSLIYLNRSLEISSGQQSYLEYYIKTSLSEVYTFMGNHNRSIDTLKRIINDKAFDVEELRSEIYLDLAQNYKALGDMDNYSLYNESYLKLNPEIKGEDINAINSVFGAEENKYKNSISNSKKNNQLLIWCIFAIIVASCGIIYLINRKNKKDKHIYSSLIDGLKNKKNKQDIAQITVTETTSNLVNISSTVEEEILRKLEKFEKSEHFTNTKLTLALLAVKLKTNNTYLSDIINREKGKNFNTYINQLRIEYICEKIYSDPKYSEYKISYLAAISGFNSHSAFATVFKNITGISPSVFLKNARLQNQKK